MIYELIYDLRIWNPSMEKETLSNFEPDHLIWNLENILFYRHFDAY